MDNKLSRYVCTMWISAVILIAARSICVAILQANGSINDAAFRQMAIDSVGPFLPILSTICLCGGLLFLLADLVVQLRNRKK